MADQDLEARLKQLQSILDERVTMLTKSPKRRSGRGNTQPPNTLKGRPTVQRSSNPPSTSTSSATGLIQEQLRSAMPAMASGSETTCRDAKSDVDLFKNGKFEVGKPLNEDVSFCPWNAVVTYPGRFIGKGNRPRARIYFDSIYEGRNWDFFYLHHPEKPKNEPYLLVPTAQFVDFLDHINNRLDTALVIPRGMEAKFSVVFQGPGMPKPRYLSRSSDQRTFKVEKWPDIANDDLEAYQAVNPPRQKEIQKFLQVFTTRHPDKVKKDSKRERENASMLHEAQRMLGVVPAQAPMDVVLICVDVEALERKPYPVSEVGIAVLDTRDLEGVPPGPAGRDWWPLIKAYHLRIKEFSGLRNFMFVQGCPNKFSFGQSTFPPKAQVAEAIMKVLKPWYPGDRKLVLVGHDVHQDIKYLSDLGINTEDMRFIRELDSQVLHKSWRHLKDGRGLEAVLSELCMHYQWLHNAGNDAVYTMRAVVGVVVEQAREVELEAKGEKYVPALFIS